MREDKVFTNLNERAGTAFMTGRAEGGAEQASNSITWFSRIQIKSHVPFNDH